MPAPELRLHTCEPRVRILIIASERPLFPGSFYPAATDSILTASSSEAANDLRGANSAAP
jgi:hypothetical protein